jgi:NitT/TauT family transport system substrate-binding protein
MARPLRIGHLSTFYHTAILLMAREDLAEHLGEEPQWELFGTGPAIVKAMEEGKLDLGYVGLPPAIVGIARGADILCVAGGHEEGTVMVGRADLEGHPEREYLGDVLVQLRGKAIGVPGRGSIHDVILADALEHYGLREDVTVKNVPWADFLVDALARDDIQAAFGTPALAAAVMVFARGKVLYPPSLIWPENPSYGILARGEFLAGEPERVESFLRLHEEATDFLRTRVDLAARTIAGHVGVVDENFIMETLAISPRYCTQLTEGYMACTARFVSAMKRLGYIDREPSLEEIFDTSLIRRIHGEGEHYSEGLITQRGEL